MISILNTNKSLSRFPGNSCYKPYTQPEFTGKLENKNSNLWDQCLIESEKCYLNTLDSAKKQGKIIKNTTLQTGAKKETEVVIDTQNGRILINENINPENNTVRIKVTETTSQNPNTDHSEQVETIWELHQREIKRVSITCGFTTYKPQGCDH